jgi:hypothetical protein
MKEEIRIDGQLLRHHPARQLRRAWHSVLYLGRSVAAARFNVLCPRQVLGAYA